jgi:multisubunit Na+/H+ antiporter MnhF subunit
MSIWLACCIALGAGAALPAVLLAMRGDPVARLIGLQQLATVTTLALLLLAQAVNQPSYLVVPLTLSLLGFAGALVFARLAVPRR